MHQSRWKYPHGLMNVLSCHFKHIVEILLSPWLNINENWHIVKSCQEIAFGNIKWSNEVTEIWKLSGWQILDGNSIMAFIFHIDHILINYSYKMTYCHFGIKRGHRSLKIGRVANVGTGNSIMAVIFKLTWQYFYMYLLFKEDITSAWNKT